MFTSPHAVLQPRVDLGAPCSRYSIINFIIAGSKYTTPLDTYFLSYTAGSSMCTFCVASFRAYTKKKVTACCSLHVHSCNTLSMLNWLHMGSQGTLGFRPEYSALHRHCYIERERAAREISDWELLPAASEEQKCTKSSRTL